MAATPRVLRSIEAALEGIYERLRKLEVRSNRIGNWTLVEDQGTGDLVAVRDNGSGQPKTVVVVAQR